MRCLMFIVLIAGAWLAFVPAERAADSATNPAHDAALKHLDALRPELIAVNQEIWTFAELGLEEHRSAARLTGVLHKAGFKVEEGVSGMPTAFIAEYGEGQPVI